MASASFNWTRRRFVIVGAAGVVAAPLLATLPNLIPKAEAVGTTEPSEKANPDFDHSKCKGCQACTILFSNCLELNNCICWYETAGAKPA